MENNERVLVTGGTGFVGMQIVLQLLQKGYRVRATIRNAASETRLKQTLAANGISNLENLSTRVTELTRDENWAEAMKDCTYVLSVASPVFFEVPENEEEAIRPAVEGILRILKFAREAGVKRVVMTSNFGAVGFSQTNKGRETTEADWTDINLRGLSVYEKSKTLAEKAAWDFVRTEGKGLELTTINPVAILGRSLDAHVSGSFHLLKNLLNGSMKMVPGIPLNVVDVADVADLHIRAMTNLKANGQRFIASADGHISLPEIASLLQERKPAEAAKVSRKRMPDWLLRLAALFNPKAKEAVMLLNVNRNVSNAKAKNILGWKPVATQEETILASVETMVKYNLLP